VLGEPSPGRVTLALGQAKRKAVHMTATVRAGSALVLAGPRHHGEEHGGATGERDRGDVLDDLHENGVCGAEPNGG